MKLLWVSRDHFYKGSVGSSSLSGPWKFSGLGSGIQTSEDSVLPNPLLNRSTEYHVWKIGGHQVAPQKDLNVELMPLSIWFRAFDVGGMWNTVEWERIILRSLNSFSPAVFQDHAFDSTKPQFHTYHPGLPGVPVWDAALCPMEHPLSSLSFIKY